MAGSVEMKVSNKKGVGFFFRAATIFLQGTEGKEGSPAREPVAELQVSGLGEAINVAVAVCTRLQQEGLAEIESVQTDYKDMSGGSSPHILIRVRRAARLLAVPSGALAVVSWNLAAINNNPFEYWISHSDEAYAQLMDQVESFVDKPGDRDVPVSEVFTQQLFEELAGYMKAEGWQGVDKVTELWRELRERKIVSGVLKDKELGAKRLCSMPDRFTNTINLASGSMAFRPTVINHSTNSLGSVAQWWPQWAEFIFKEELEVKTGKNGDTKRIRPCQMLTTIKKAKYPAITEEEEAVSVPLQCICLAIFDAVLVHMLQVLSPDGHWQQIKSSICEATFRRKNALTSRILHSYSDAAVICLQEASAAYIESLRKWPTHHVYAKVDEQRDQNSAVLLSKAAFPSGAQELTEDVISALTGTPVEAGDLVAVRAEHVSGKSYLIASFHGDTNGQATAPVLRALHKVGGEVLVGMDANTYLTGSSTLYGVQEFLGECRGLGLRSCWPEEDMSKYLTTCNARTFLQPQLNKAVPSSKKLEKGDVNPKDHIVFNLGSFEPVQVIKDNTGQGKYIEAVCFPSLAFPSDHGLIAAVLKPSAL